jgi:hypothetical protein
MSGTLSGLPMVTFDYSLTATGTSALAFNALSFPPRFMRIWNVSATDTIWCSRSGAGVVGGVGCFPLGPREREEFTFPQIIPANALHIISDGASTPVTIEVGQ